jgi:CRP-like cAMP-binding protein
MKNMLALRYLALASNFAFMAYGLHDSIVISVLLNGALIPVNARRLWEIRKLTRDIAAASAETPVSEWLLPHMNRRSFKAGEVLFNKGDKADKLYYLSKGNLRLQEIGRILKPGELIGEIGVFSPDKARTQTLICETDGELYDMTEDMVYQLYYKTPKLGFYLIRLLALHLMHDVRLRDAEKSAVA